MAYVTRINGKINAIVKDKTQEQIANDNPELIEFKNSWNTYDKQRKEAILEKWPVDKQLEAITESSLGRPEKMGALLTDIEAIKSAIPKG